MNSLETLVAPAARIEDLVITESGSELLVFDTQSNELHHLDQLSAAVWRQLDGRSTENDILQITRASLGDHVTADSIQLAIIGLGKANLLSGQVASSQNDGASSRRRFLKKAGLAASIPVIASVTAPAAYAQVSPQVCDSEDLNCSSVTDTVCCDCGNGRLRLGVGLCASVGQIDIALCLSVCALP